MHNKSRLSTPLESIPPMDILAVLGRGPDDFERANLALDIAQEVASKQEHGPTSSVAFLKPLVYFCGNEPWHRVADGPKSGGVPIEAAGMFGHAMELLDSGQYPKLTESHFRQVGGDSTIASMAEIAVSTEVANNTEGSVTFLTDELHDKYGRVGRSALAVFGASRQLKVVTYPSPRGLKEEIMEIGMSWLIYRALRNTAPGDCAQALAAQRRTEKRLRIFGAG